MAIVNTFQEFYNAITDSVTTDIVLGNNIAFGSGGIPIQKTKGNITIDGNGYTITDYSSTLSNNCLRLVDISGSITVTVKNVIWNGKNYYGMVYVPDSSNGNNVTTVYENVRYTGPQASYNRRGITNFTDCTIKIERNGGAADPQEFVEVNRLIIGGTVTVDAQTASDSVIWFTYYNTSLTVEQDAVFIVNALLTYMFYSDVSEPAMLFEANSKTSITTAFGLFLYSGTSNHMASSFTVRSNASFSSIQIARNGTVPTLKCRNNLTVENNASLYVAVPPTGTASPLIYFPETASVNFYNPKSIVLYNISGPIFSFNRGTTASPNVININAELLNMWTTAKPYASAGNFEDTPQRAINKIDGQNIDAVIYTTSSTTSSITSNLLPVDTGAPLTAANFNIIQARVISMGSIDIEHESITDISTSFTGTTEKQANTRIIYNTTVLNGISDNEGQFDMPIPVPFAAGSEFSFGVNWMFLIKFIKVNVEGSVRISHLSELIFTTFVSPISNSIVQRVDESWYIEVTDTRLVLGMDWFLYVSLPTPLTSGTDTLSDALILKQNTFQLIVPSTFILVVQGLSTGSPKVTRISWNKLEGFLLKIVSDYYYNAGYYVSRMNWQLRETQI